MFDIVKLRQAWLMPLIFFQGYLSLILFIYFAGPWPWDQRNTAELVVYLVAAQICIAIGYAASWPTVQRGAFAINPYAREKSISHGQWFFNVSFWVFLILLVPTSLSRSGSSIPNVIEGLNYTGKVYNDNFERLTSGNLYVFVEYFRMIVSPFLAAMFPLLILYWRKISVLKRCVSVIIILYYISIYLAIGVNKGIIDFILLLPWLVFLSDKAQSGGLHIPRSIFIVFLLVMFFAFILFFGQGQIQRSGNVGVAGVFNSGFSIIYADSGAIGDILTNDQRIAYESLVRYLTSGYYALSHSFNIPHDNTYGLGQSIFLSVNVDQIFGTSYFSMNSLPGQMEQKIGFPQFALWHSIYPWLASDFGHWGALVVIGIFSYIFGASWGRSLTHLDVRSIVMTTLMLILFYYIPANNQIFQSGESCLCFLLLGGWYVIDRLRRRNVSQRRYGGRLPSRYPYKESRV